MDGHRNVSSCGARDDLWFGDSVPPQWHPKIARFFLYWRSIHPASGLPGRQHFDPLAIHSLLPGIWLLDIQRHPFRLRYRLAGTEAVEAIGSEVTGKWMDEAHVTVAQEPAYMERYRAVVEQGVPSWRRGVPRLWTHKKYTMLENIVVPLATDSVTVDLLACLTVFHAEPPAGDADRRQGPFIAARPV